jgi:hypothetical protein
MCFLEDGFAFLNPALLLAEPYRLAAGHSLSLYYRVLVHQGWRAPEQLERDYADFAGERRTTATS